MVFDILVSTTFRFGLHRLHIDGGDIIYIKCLLWACEGTWICIGWFLFPFVVIFVVDSDMYFCLAVQEFTAHCVYNINFCTDINNFSCSWYTAMYVSISRPCSGQFTDTEYPHYSNYIFLLVYPKLIIILMLQLKHCSTIWNGCIMECAGHQSLYQPHSS